VREGGLRVDAPFLGLAVDVLALAPPESSISYKIVPFRDSFFSGMRVKIYFTLQIVFFPFLFL